MGIVSSVIVEDRVQADGRRQVRERHTDHLGKVVDISYRAMPGADANAAMAARVNGLEANLAATELVEIVQRIRAGRRFGGTPDYTTIPNIAARVADVYLGAPGVYAANFAEWLNGRTDALLRNVFGIGQPAIAGLRARFVELVALRDAIESQAGTLT